MKRPRGHHGAGKAKLRRGLWRSINSRLGLCRFASAPSASELYLECCAQCHGKTGRGDGPSANGLPSRPRNFTDCKTMVGIPDGVLFKAIKQGGAAVGLQDSMPSWEAALDERDTGSVQNV